MRQLRCKYCKKAHWSMRCQWVDDELGDCVCEDCRKGMDSFSSGVLRYTRLGDEMPEQQICAHCHRTRRVLTRCARWAEGMHIIEMLCSKCIGYWVEQGYNVKKHGYNEVAPWNINAQNLSEKVQALATENARLRKVNTATAEAYDKQTHHNVELQDQNMSLTARLAMCEDERGTLQSQLNVMRENRDGLEGRIAELEGINAQNISYAQRTARENKNLEAECKRLREGCDRHVATIDRLKAELEKAKTCSSNDLAKVHRAGEAAQKLEAVNQNLRKANDALHSQLAAMRESGDLSKQLEVVSAGRKSDEMEIARLNQIIDDLNARIEEAYQKLMQDKHGTEWRNGVAGFWVELDNGMVFEGEVINSEVATEVGGGRWVDAFNLPVVRSRPIYHLYLKGKLRSMSYAGTESAAQGSNGATESSGDNCGDTPDSD